LGKDNHLLKGGELIRLEHIETEGHLACEGYDFTKDDMAEMYVRLYKGEILGATLFIIDKDSSDIEGIPCVWTSSDRTRDYRIRHFVWLMRQRVIQFHNLNILMRSLMKLWRIFVGVLNLGWFLLL
jgi:hypothetical protein